ncbi:uncharacterized protein A1O9_06396 [Exophiala aquamarina CBS 119918]|uniref:Heterokaryon incompatibility domain-containing protein n=1 Tax=Exophiala aquamarina CBS 119918 TaxID=1182545 RepID=A0A072PSG6_9EURO|nr:uncharacterized protein A1O9_06396 [Exophiala aquamarina CBS 119918]KEF58470.1 hypothetical protein A1O9_06396 [Exophiala aquamarina CBS 119918]
MSHEWLAFIPLQPMSGFLQPLLESIRQILSEQELFLSMDGSLHKPGQLRILPSDFTHESEPLVSGSGKAWCFLSKEYTSSHYPALLKLGASILVVNEALDLIKDDLQRRKSRLRTRPLRDSWHDTFTTFINDLLARNNADYREGIRGMCIIPVRANRTLEWHRPGPDIFLPHAVNEGTGPECILIEMPINIDIVVLQPDAATAPRRRDLYLALGVQQASTLHIRTAITKLMTKSAGGCRFDLLRSAELLFWFNLPLGSRDELKAWTSGDIDDHTKLLFMRSREQYHAECLVRLDENPDYGKHFLDESYQSSQVASRSRGGKTWRQWLTEVAGVRWYPPLADLSSPKMLHWMLDFVHRRDSILFLSVIQTYWAQEYSSTCRAKPELAEVLQKCQVLCKHGGTQELSKCWFPTSKILDAARKYGVENRIPILALPDATQEHLISDWPALRDLGMRHSLQLWFYRQAISLLSATGQPPIVSSLKLGCLYRDIADRLTLEDRWNIQVRHGDLTDTLPNNRQDDFKNQSLIWDPAGNVWRTMDQCVWESDITLHRRFIITSVYEKATVSGLFAIHLQVPSVSIECLVEELEYLRDSHRPETNAEFQTTISKVYTHLAGMNATVEQEEIIRLVESPTKRDARADKLQVFIQGKESDL